jgi:AraC family transcriptional regulator
MVEADIHTLYKSDFYRILDFKCKCKDCSTSKPEHSESFSISFVRKGNFLFNVYKHSLDSYTGCVLITKPWYERTVTHTHAIPDECTIFDFTQPFFDEIKESYNTFHFLVNNDVHASLVKTDAAAEVLHRRVLLQVCSNTTEKLKMDSMVMDIIENIFGKINDYKHPHQLPISLKKYHLTTIETAKEYILLHYQNDISLVELARHCHVSPFYFSRIFKQITAYSPYQFLTAVRLKNAALLIKETTAPIVDIALQAGFNSIEHFTTSFTQKFGSSPTAYRSSKNNRTVKK